MSWQTNVDGNPEGGWIVDVHDGMQAGTYHPTEAANADEAATKARALHAEATRQPDPDVPVNDNAAADAAAAEAERARLAELSASLEAERRATAEAAEMERRRVLPQAETAAETGQAVVPAEPIPVVQVASDPNQKSDDSIPYSATPGPNATLEPEG
jgi:hypothetical protein